MWYLLAKLSFKGYYTELADVDLIAASRSHFSVKLGEIGSEEAGCNRNTRIIVMYE